MRALALVSHNAFHILEPRITITDPRLRPCESPPNFFGSRTDNYQVVLNDIPSYLLDFTLEQSFQRSFHRRMGSAKWYFKLGMEDRFCS